MNKKNEGFTILEIAIVMAIIGLLLILTVPKFSYWFDEIAVQNIASEIAADIRYTEELEQINYAKADNECYYFEFFPDFTPYKRYEIYHFENSSKIVDKSVNIKYNIECSGQVGAKILKKIRFNKFFEAIPYDTNNHPHSNFKFTITVKKGNIIHKITIVRLTGGVTIQ